MPYRTSVNVVRDGEAVKASVANRPLHELQANIDYLKSLFEAAFLGQAVIARAQIVEPDALVGHAVWFNEETSRFERALFGVEVDSTTGALVATRRSVVWGVVIEKQAGSSADIVLSGLVEIDVENLVGTGNTAQAGIWYLSGSEPGRLNHSRSPNGVPVLMMGGSTETGLRQLYVKPDIQDPVSSHRHYRFELVCAPAGEHVPPDPGDPHVITDADSSKEGWLPADDPIFDGNAPVGAVFGYNIRQSAFYELWPPFDQAEITLSRGDDAAILGCSVPSGQNQPVVIDEHGIWWMLDCYGQVPWPTDWGAENSGSVDVTCPILPPMQGVLWFTRMTFFTAATAVLSLAAKAGSGLSVYCKSDGSDAATGHLEIDLELDFVGAGDEEAGHLVFKSVDGVTFSRGPVLESIKAGTDNVTITSDQDELDGGKLVGNVVLSVTDRTNGVEYPVTALKLNRTTLEFYEDVLTYGFASDRESSFRGEIAIPSGITLPEGSTMKLTCLVLGRGAGTVPADAFTASYRRISYPPNSTPVVLPTSDTAVDFTAGATLSVAGKYYRAESDEFEIAAGDTVQFTISRAGSDGYSSDLLLFRLCGQLVVN